MPSHPRPWLSILIPVHNVAPWLGACLDSILRQPLAGVELVLLDDASSDGSSAIAALWRLRHPARIRLLGHDRNRGIAAVRNRLLAEARGDYVWFVDSDDLVGDGAIARLRAVVGADAPDLVLCDFATLRERPRLRHRLRGEGHRSAFAGDATVLRTDFSALVEGVMRSRHLHPWSKIARREVWRRVDFPEGRCFEDVHAMPALLSGVRSYRHVAEPWIGYRQRPGSIVSSITPDKARDLLAAFPVFAAFLDRHGARLAPPARLAVQEFCLRTQRSLLRNLRDATPAQRASLRAEAESGLARVVPEGRVGFVVQCLRQHRWRSAWRGLAGWPSPVAPSPCREPA